MLVPMLRAANMNNVNRGRDPEDSIDHRLDAGPPEKSRRMIMITFKLDTVTSFIKKLLRIKK